jgi:tRNA A37 threonylcarbamoyladenosine synthetase subunit TsaC/SUA5/YrdC
MPPILDIADLTQRREAAEATADGAALFYPFGNFYALAARPDLGGVRALNALKGRPRDQVGSVTTTPEKAKLVFDWDAIELPWSALVAVMGDLNALGPIGFRGPASARIPEHLTANGTVQLIAPGDVCPGNDLVGETLDLIGEDVLAITSANAHGAGAAHFEIKQIQREFGQREGVVLIGHRHERAVRRRYPRHLPCSTSIVAVHGNALTLERHGSLDALTILEIATRHGLRLEIGDGATERLPVRRPARPARPAFARRRAMRASARLARVTG